MMAKKKKKKENGRYDCPVKSVRSAASEKILEGVCAWERMRKIDA